MKKRIISVMAALSLTASSCAAFAATGFSDLNEFHTWAEPQIEEMTTLGIIKGYTDGTFRPDNAITKTEALVLVARAAGFVSEDYSDFTNAAYARYASFVNTYNTLYPNEVSFLLYKGILTESEMTGYIASERASSPLLRHEMAFLLTRLMRAEGSLKSQADIRLNFSDAGDIPFDAIPYVNYVSSVALMQGVYDPLYPNDTFFQPYSSVTRAQMAVLLHRVLGKSKITIFYGSLIGKNSENGTLTYKTDDKTSVFKFEGALNLMVDGYRANSVEPAEAGAKIAFFSINGTLCDVEIVNDAAHKYNGALYEGAAPSVPISGAIESINLGAVTSVTVNGTAYNILSSASVSVNSEPATVYDLRVGQSVYLEFAGGGASLVKASDANDMSNVLLSSNGYIESVDYDAGVITVSLKDKGARRKIYLTDDAAIIDAETGALMRIETLDTDMEITATGTIVDGVFYATRIILHD